MSERKEDTTDFINQGKRKALIISISDYFDNKLQPLDFCQKDGQEMYEILQKLGYEIKDDCRLIGRVKFETMRDAIYDFFDNSQTAANDTLLFYYSGHGIPISEGNMCLASSETNPDTPKKRGFTSYELTNLIQESNSIRIVEILDCCYSGANKVSKGDQDNAAQLGTDAIEKNKMMLQQGQGKCLLAASQAAQEAYGLKEKDHSIFTYYLLEGLKGNENSVDVAGNVTPHSLGNYVYNAILNLPSEKRPRQKPITKTEASGDIILAHYPELSKKGNDIITRAEEYYKKGLDLFDSASYDEAIEYFNRALEINHQNPEIWYKKGYALSKLNRYSNAIRCFDEVLQINPSYADAWYNKGGAFYYKAKYNEAIESYEQALKINPKNVVAWMAKGNSLDKLNKYDEAITCYDKVLQINPNNTMAQKNKIRSLDNSKKFRLPTEATLSGDRKALLIGISDYDNRYLQSLEFCKENVGKIYETLNSLGYEIAEGNRLTGKAKWETLRQAIFKFFNEDIKPKDTLLFYFCGHVIPDSYGKLYISTSEIDPEIPSFRGISFEEIISISYRSVSERIVMILDCCCSGLAKVSKGSEEDAAMLGSAAINEATKILSEKEGLNLLAASQATQESYGLMKKRHSIFTYYLLEGLKGNEKSIDSNGNITPNTLGTYILREIMNLPTEKRPIQIPITKTEASGDIILAHYPKLIK